MMANGSQHSEHSSSLGNQPVPKFRVRRMRVDDVPQVLQIWADNGLHEGTHTIQSFMQVDPAGFIVAVQVDEDASSDEEEPEPDSAASTNQSSLPNSSNNSRLRSQNFDW